MCNKKSSSVRRDRLYSKPGLVPGLIIIVFLLNACGGSAASVETPRPPTVTPIPTLAWTGPTVTPGGPFPTGVYEAVRPLDTNRLEFFANGTYTANLAVVKFVARGTYVMDGNEIVFNEEKGPCSGIPGGYPGRYTWSFDGNLMIFAVVEDPCPVPRNFDLGRQWIKQP